MDAAKTAHGFQYHSTFGVQGNLLIFFDMSRIISGLWGSMYSVLSWELWIEAALETVRLSAEAKNIRLQRLSTLWLVSCQ